MTLESNDQALVDALVATLDAYGRTRLERNNLLQEAMELRGQLQDAIADRDEAIRSQDRAELRADDAEAERQVAERALADAVKALNDARRGAT